LEYCGKNPIGRRPADISLRKKEKEKRKEKKRFFNSMDLRNPIP
jgi:hypothetical protein